MDGESLVVGRFFKVLMPGFETSLKLPPAFTKTLNSVDLKLKMAVLKSCKGSWKVIVKKCDDGLLHFFGEGWEVYVSEHELKVAEIIVFEHRGCLHFDTLVFDETSCLKDFASSQNDEDDVECLEHVVPIDDGEEEVPPGGSKQNLNSQFQITLTNCKLLEGYMYIPKAFATSNGISEEEGTVTLRNAVGDSWQAKLNVYTKYKGNGACHNRFCVRGLSKFFKGNELKVGDTCIFEFDHYSANSKHVVMNVLFVRKG